MPQVRHPLVRIHPVTQRKSLFISPHTMVGIDGMSETDGRGLLDELIEDHKEQSNLRKIESLEQKLINNLDESSYSELIKLKNQLNRE